MSEFIENSKHAAMTAAVESHILGPGKARTLPGEATGANFPQYGDSQYNPEPAPSVPNGSGINYINPNQAGHTIR